MNKENRKAIAYFDKKGAVDGVLHIIEPTFRGKYDLEKGKEFIRGEFAEFGDNRTIIETDYPHTQGYPSDKKGNPIKVYTQNGIVNKCLCNGTKYSLYHDEKLKELVEQLGAVYKL
ncbi:MAG: hypothetical protein ACK5LT_06490 [Lachnospirales bacterium]